MNCCPLCLEELASTEPKNGQMFRMCYKKESILKDNISDHIEYDMNHYYIYLSFYPPKSEEHLWIYPYNIIIMNDHTSIYSLINDNRGELVIKIPYKLHVLPEHEMLNKIQTILVFS